MERRREGNREKESQNLCPPDAALVHQSEEQVPPSHRDKETLMETLVMAWQLCGDIHCLSTKVSTTTSGRRGGALLNPPPPSWL